MDLFSSHCCSHYLGLNMINIMILIQQSSCIKCSMYMDGEEHIQFGTLQVQTQHSDGNHKFLKSNQRRWCQTVSDYPEAKRTSTETNKETEPYAPPLPLGNRIILHMGHTCCSYIWTPEQVVSIAQRGAEIINVGDLLLCHVNILLCYYHHIQSGLYRDPGF